MSRTSFIVIEVGLFVVVAVGFSEPLLHAEMVNSKASGNIKVDFLEENIVRISLGSIVRCVEIERIGNIRRIANSNPHFP